MVGAKVVTGHRKQLKRFETGSVRFLTFSCVGHENLLGTAAAREVFVQHLTWLAHKGQFALHAFAVMPDHVHLLLTPAQDQTVDKILEGLKKRTSLKINRLLNRTGPVWQPGGGYDRNIDTRDEYREKVAYIHQNPERRNLVDWQHSSANAYLDMAYNGPEIVFLDDDFKW